MDPERLIGQAKNKISSLGNKIPQKKNIVPKILELYFFGPMTRSKKRFSTKKTRYLKNITLAECILLG